MKRYILLASFALIGSWLCAGGAYGACSPFSLEAKNYSLDWSPRDPFLFAMAAPEQAYVIASWHCDEKYQWHGEYRTGLKRDLPLNPIGELDRLRNLSSTELKTWDDGHFACKLGDTSEACKAYALLEPFAIRQLRASAPAPIVWTVRPNGSNSSRPVFRINTNGTRNTTAVSGERVAVGEPCKCFAKVIEEPVSNSDAVNAWCSVQGSDNVSTTAVDSLPERVTWCVRR